MFFLVSIRTVSEPIFLPFPNPRFQPSVVGSFTNWKLRELSANFAPNVSVISRGELGRQWEPSTTSHVLELIAVL